MVQQLPGLNTPRFCAGMDQTYLLAAEQDANDKASTRPKKYLRIGTESKEKVVVALTNLRTEDSDWAATACGKPNLSRKRYQRISKLVNDVLKLNPRPDYALFPELSIPLRWLNSIATRLSAAGISLIAGTEYRHSGDNKIPKRSGSGSGR